MARALARQRVDAVMELRQGEIADGPCVPSCASAPSCAGCVAMDTLDDSMQPLDLTAEEVRGVWRGQVSVLLRQVWPQRTTLETDLRCPHGAPGEVRWVREEFAQHRGGIVRYRAGWPCYDRGAPDTTPNGRAVQRFLSHDYEMPKVRRVCWRPAQDMPRADSRMVVKVSGVRVVRVRDVTVADAEAAGIVGWTKAGTVYKYAPADEETDGPRWSWGGYDGEEACPRTPLEAFARWQLETRRAAWEWNHWVWLISVERAEVPCG